MISSMYSRSWEFANWSQRVMTKFSNLTWLDMYVGRWGEFVFWPFTLLLYFALDYWSTSSQTTDSVSEGHKMPGHGMEVHKGGAPVEPHSHVALSSQRWPGRRACALQHFQSGRWLLCFSGSSVCGGVSNLSDACVKNMLLFRICCSGCD